MINQSSEMSPRESLEHEWRVEEFGKQAEHAIAIKKLELESQVLEAKWSSWLKIPITIIKLPVYILFGIGYICSVLTKQEPSDNFWRFIK